MDGNISCLGGKNMFKDDHKQYAIWGITAFCVVAASVLFFFFIFRLNSVGLLFGKIIKILSPVIYGLVIAYLLGPIANFWNRKLNVVLGEHLDNKSHVKKIAKGCSVLIALLIAIITISGLLVLVLPRLAESIAVIIDSFPSYIRLVL